MQILPPLAATGIGSTPFLDSHAAARLILDNLTEMPFWPQLPQKGFLEDMVPQGAGGLPLMRLDSEQRLVRLDERADREEGLTDFYEAVLQLDLDRFGLSPDEASGFYALLEELPASGGGGPEYVKGQIVGPITFATIVKGADGKAILFDQELTQAVTQGLALKAAWQAAKIRETGRRAIIFFDEPSLSGFGSAFMPISREEVIRLLTETITSARQAGPICFGIHCCGNTDWSMLLETPIDILSFESYEYFATLKLYVKALKDFLARGGYLAWGLVPTSPTAPIETEAALWQRFESQIRELADLGMDERLVLSQSLLTPACGLGYLSPEQARTAIVTLASLSQRGKTWLASL
ncbi:hypothetical protein [Desulfobacca acetoxidans]